MFLPLPLRTQQSKTSRKSQRDNVSHYGMSLSSPMFFTSCLLGWDAAFFKRYLLPCVSKSPAKLTRVTHRNARNQKHGYHPWCWQNRRERSNVSWSSLYEFRSSFMKSVEIFLTSYSRGYFVIKPQEACSHEKVERVSNTQKLRSKHVYKSWHASFIIGFSFISLSLPLV